MAEEPRNTSIESTRQPSLMELGWQDIHEPGAYVELGSGDLYRIPKEALIAGASPVVVKESRGLSRLVLVSKDPFVTTLQARLRCAQHNIEANF